MRFKNRFSMLARAALFAVLALGIMASGLTITTYSLAKANELVMAQIQGEPFERQGAERICLE